MRSIKPGRGPSALGALSGTFGVLFGIAWTVLAFVMTRDSPFPLVGIIFPLFGVGFVIFGIVGVLYNARNATAKDRFSTFDITSPGEEEDPLNEVFGNTDDNAEERSSEETVRSRLQKVEELREKQLISEEEYLKQRERILSEI